MDRHEVVVKLLSKKFKELNNIITRGKIEGQLPELNKINKMINSKVKDYGEFFKLIGELNIKIQKSKSKEKKEIAEHLEKVKKQLEYIQELDFENYTSKLVTIDKK